MTATPNRKRTPPDRQRDAERTKAKLIDAAREEFAAKGRAGARVQDIANRAGVDKQLISYYFGGKDGLYDEIARAWQQRETALQQESLALPEVAVRYLREALADPRLTRMFIWQGLTADLDKPAEAGDTPEIHSMRERKHRGELASDLDEAAVVLALNGAVAVAALMPELVQRLYGVPPSDPEFAERYGEQLRRMVGRLALPAGPELTDHAPPPAAH
ncbi:TetR family transcriptional regulator [Nocardia sp. NPDC006630]|uniref:TetR family transcriptional regulator n=1 Tax=Nocardia sp. NPDC006630 TaxID=3157181 RepID=UPI00339EFFD3